MEENRFIQKYKDGTIPWDTGRPDYNLIENVNDFPIVKCKTLELGCGTGENAIWLRKNGFEVTAFDVSGIAINKAKQKAEKAKLELNFLVADFFKDKIPSAPFEFAFDRGVFHSFSEDAERDLFAGKVANCLNTNGLWLSLIGSADEKVAVGPPRRTATSIVKAVEPYFELIYIKTGYFDSLDKKPHKIWICLMRKR